MHEAEHMVKYNQVIILYIPHRDEHQIYTYEKLTNQCSPKSDSSRSEYLLFILKNKNKNKTPNKKTNKKPQQNQNK